MNMRAPIEQQLRAHGIKPTPQRVEIGRVLLTHPRHMSADQLISELRVAGSTVSKATVYNTLNLFAEKGVVREVAVDPKHLVYDSTAGPHHHFFNVDTGQLLDIDTNTLEIKGLPMPPDGTEAESVEVLVRIRNRQD